MKRRALIRSLERLGSQLEDARSEVFDRWPASEAVDHLGCAFDEVVAALDLLAEKQGR